MPLPSATRVATNLLRTRGQTLATTARTLTTASASPTPFNTTATASSSSYNPGTEKHFVRIAGPSSYATRMDLEFFLTSHGIAPTSIADDGTPIHRLVQGQSDVFQNQSIWIYDAGSATAAGDAAARLSGRVAGLKLVRAAAIDNRLVEDMLAAPEQGRNNRRLSLRRRMNVIQPLPEERGRALLATNLPFNLATRFLWSFFASYEIETVRHLRRSGVACVVFMNEAEAFRAIRERSNLPIQGNRQHIMLKFHD